MKENTKKIAGLAGSTLMIASMGASATLAFANTEATDPPVAAQEQVSIATSNETVRLDTVQGAFAFTQEAVASTDQISRALGAAKYLCGSSFTGVEGESADSWVITVDGNVIQPLAATMEELAEDGEVHAIMGCSCAGNPADGAASVNAEVKGISVAYMLEEAGVNADTNTLVFTSADGYEVALPLNYVVQRTSMIVYSVNGGEICDAIGGTNQLWLGSTSGRYFVRNVASITAETRQTPPPVPGSEAAGDTYANVPNISVAYGGTA